MNLHLLLITETNLHIYSVPLFLYDVIFASQELRSAPLLSTLSRLSRNLSPHGIVFYSMQQWVAASNQNVSNKRSSNNHM